MTASSLAAAASAAGAGASGVAGRERVRLTQVAVVVGGDGNLQAALAPVPGVEQPRLGFVASIDEREALRDRVRQVNQ